MDNPVIWPEVILRVLTAVIVIATVVVATADAIPYEWHTTDTHKETRTL